LNIKWVADALRANSKTYDRIDRKARIELAIEDRGAPVSGQAAGTMAGIQTRMSAELTRLVTSLTIETIIPESYVGEGIRRTPAYTVELTEEQFKRWREQFWDTRVEGKPEIWEAIRQCCEAPDDATARALADANGLILENDLIKFCYDSTGASYKTPIACINEPLSYGEDKEEERLNARQEPDEPKELSLKIRNATKFEDKTIEISESASVLQLKLKYAELYGVTDIGDEGELV
jgi:hypothetical protein